jgi:hypothetical protein
MLALIPVCAAVIFGALILPRAAVPDTVPLPRVDTAALARVHAQDDQWVQDANAHPLSGTLLLLGTAIRNFVRLEVAEQFDQGQIDLARQAIDTAAVEAFQKDGAEGMQRLRAVQGARFVEAVHAFEATGKVSEELTDLGGDFVGHMRAVGWIEGNRVLFTDDALRALEKARWNQIVNADKNPLFALDLQEQRVLYAFYLSHPIAEGRAGSSFAERRKTAKKADECHMISLAENAAKEKWRLDRIKRLGALDKEYPTSFALGISQYRLGSYPASVEAFRTQLSETPNGPYTQLARSYLRAAVREAEMND